MANEQRRQQRIEGTYLRLLAVVNEGWALMERDAPDKEAPDYRAVQQLVEGILSELDAFGSDEIRGLFETWRVVWGLFGIDVHNARVRAGSAGPDKWDREVLETHRSEARESAKLLIAQAATELRGQANSIECPSDE
jgi:hypothetical protein